MQQSKYQIEIKIFGPYYVDKGKYFIASRSHLPNWTFGWRGPLVIMMTVICKANGRPGLTRFLVCGYEHSRSDSGFKNIIK